VFDYTDLMAMDMSQTYNTQYIVMGIP
jgi:hypothetical protein